MRVPNPYPLCSLKLLITCELQANATEFSGLKFWTTAEDLGADTEDHPRKDMVSLPDLLHPLRSPPGDSFLLRSKCSELMS